MNERLGSAPTAVGRPRLGDHVPSRVLLDEPYPPNLPVVPACRACNEAASADEEYVACAVECALAGSTAFEDAARPKIRRLLMEKAALAARLRSSQARDQDGFRLQVETERVRRVLIKLARGHAFFELALPQPEEPSAVWFAPFASIDPVTREAFESMPESVPPSSAWPEVGSRAMQRLVSGFPDGQPWLQVQPGRYRYMTDVQAGALVRMVLSEYLACEVSWSE